LDAQTLGQISVSTASDYGLTLDASALTELKNCIPSINRRGFTDKTSEDGAVKAALQTMFSDALATIGPRQLNSSDIRDIFGRLCPLPPFC
jgi:hypothetical protein